MSAGLRQNKTRKRKENLLAVFFAFVLSFGVYTIGQQTGYLTADVVGGPQAEFNTYSDVVVAPKGEDGIALYAGKNLTNIVSMSIILLFDPTTVELANDSFRGSMDIVYSAAGQGQGTVVLTNTKQKSFAVKDNLVDIIAPGAFHDLVVGDIFVMFEDGSQESLSVELPK